MINYSVIATSVYSVLFELQVTYPTALDYFVFLSFLYIFCTVVQFGLVHHFTKLGSGEYYVAELEQEEV